MRSSSWQGGTFQAQHPTIHDEQVVLSAQEFSMLQQVRSLNGGSYTMYLVKTARGRDGLHSFRLSENRVEEQSET